MGAPIGNQNAAKGKRWADAVERALERRITGNPVVDDRSDRMKAIDAAADLFVLQMFADKDLGYFKELGDRLDGKPTQQVDATVRGNLASILSAISVGDNPPLEE